MQEKLDLRHNALYKPFPVRLLILTESPLRRRIRIFLAAVVSAWLLPGTGFAQTGPMTAAGGRGAGENSSLRAGGYGSGPDFTPLAPLYIKSPDQVRIVAAGNLKLIGWDDSKELAAVETLIREGKFQAALIPARRALGSNQADRIRWLMVTAWLERNTGSLDTAERYLREAAGRCGNSGHAQWAGVQTQLADLLRQRGDYQGSYQLWSTLAALPEAAGLPQTLEGRGMVLAELGEWEEAERCLGAAIAAWRDSGGRGLDLLQARYNLAALYVRLGFYDKAQPILNEIALSTDVPPQHPVRIRPLVALGFLVARRDPAMDLPTRQLVRGLLEEASAGMEFTQGKESPAAAEILTALAALDCREGLPAEAMDRYQYALMIRLQKLGGEHPATLTTMHEQGELLLNDGDPGKAGQKFGLAAAGFARRLGPRHPAAVAALERSALCAALLGREAEATTAALSLAEAHASQRQCLLSFASSREIADFYRGGMPWDLPCQLGNASLALRSALLFKGTADEEMTRQRYLLMRAREDPQTHHLLLRLQTAKARLRQQMLHESSVSVHSLRHAHEAVDEAESQIARAFHEHKSGPYGQDLTLMALRSAVGMSGALVEYLKYPHRTLEQPRGTEHYAAVVLLGRTGDCHFIRLGPAAELDAAVARFHQKVRTQEVPGAEVAAAAAELHQRLWQPVASLLKYVREVAVSPHGQLNFVPFAALPDADGIFAGEQLTIRTLASARDLVDKTESPRLAGHPRNTALLVGNPFFNDSSVLRPRPGSLRGTPDTAAQPPQLGHLKQAEAEARLLQERLVWGGWQSTLIADEEATEERLMTLLGQSPPPRLLHFATHGLFQDRPTGGPADILGRGGLALAGAQTTLNQWFKGQSLPTARDGILLSDEVATLNLHGTELAVLSACRTGAGEVLDVEGVMGLRRAFTIAGARSLLVALWVIGDGETKVLMQAFYETWLEGRSASSALQQAQSAALVRLRSQSSGGVGTAIRGAGAFMILSRGPLGLAQK